MKTLLASRPPLALALLLPLLWVAPALSQETDKPDSAPAKPSAKKAVDPEKEKKAAKKPLGRLPNYYSQVVDEQQRAEIYRIQNRFDDQIAALRKQLEELLAARNAAVEAVLTPEQLAKVRQIASEAASRKEPAPAPKRSADE